MDTLNNISFTHRYWIILLPLILMAADIVTGWIQASINSTWDSTKMRVGLFRKSGELLVIVVAYAIYVAVQLPIDVPAFIAVYIIAMELISICENLNQAGLPVPVWITRRLKKVAKDLSEDDPIGEIDDRMADKYWDDEDEEEQHDNS